MCEGSRSDSFIARYELWDLVSRNVIDWFHYQSDGALTIQACIEVDDAENYVLIEYGDTVSNERVHIGDDLVWWLTTTRTEWQSLDHRC